MENRWEHYSHTADMGIRGFGRTAEEAFASAAVALVAISINPEKIVGTQTVDIICEQSDRELLLIEWLNGILYEMATRRMVFGRFEVQIERERLTGRAWGERLDLERHQPGVEIKGTSYADLKVACENGKWIAQCIIDI